VAERVWQLERSLVRKIFSIDEQLVLASVVKPDHGHGVEHRRETCGFNIEVNAVPSEIGKDSPRFPKGRQALKKTGVFALYGVAGTGDVIIEFLLKAWRDVAETLFETIRIVPIVNAVGPEIPARFSCRCRECG
jgi:hypothetical protein